MNFSLRSICNEAVLHQYKDIDAAFTISPLRMFSQIRFNMKGKKKSHFDYCENASISTMLSHRSGFYLEAEEKMKCIAVRIWHFEFDRESPMASFEETDAAASVQSTNRLLYTWSFEKIIQKNKVNTHQRFKLLMWCSHFLPDYSLRLLKFEDLGLFGLGSVIWM